MRNAQARLVGSIDRKAVCGNMTASTLGSTGVIISEKKITFAERRSFRLNTV
jgi:hypothetical protein